ncbi:hypothetical protein [Streptomyces albidus (ex Kaewkla and Franco 2022)]|uniref:hypothetical protein n=1 Tax=Streptomyces albidus (ex Kaewkla and Franco 2022) TaxID=722709 RepID=UPI0015EF3F8E|nr:hypothetical protein [Streptomyces albidus (ex Kaewkla and Franco 2022)]
MVGLGRDGLFGGSREPELELGGVSPYTPLPAPSWKGRALGGFFFLIGLVCVGISVYNAAHTAGFAGRHGTVTVQRCWIDQGGRNSSDKTVCSGTFRPDDGGTSQRDAVVHRDLKAGDEIAVQQTGRGYLPSGLAETWRWNALFFIGWIAAALGVPFAATGIFPGRSQASQVGALISGTRAAKVMKYLFIGGAGGAAVCFYLTWVL